MLELGPGGGDAAAGWTSRGLPGSVIGGDVWVLPPGGGGGTSGTLSGGMIFSVVGVTGVGLPGKIGGTGPGGGGVGPFAVLLAEPGRTTVSES